VVPCSLGKPAKEAQLLATRKVKKSGLFRSGREVLQNSDFVSYSVLLYFNRLV